MILPWIELGPVPGFGVGLYAVKPIPCGTITMIECAGCSRISPQDAERSSDRNFIFSHAPITASTYPNFLVPCDRRMYYGNHSCDANTLDTRLGFDIAIRDIDANECVTVDYRRFTDSTIRFHCRCGVAECCGEVRCEVPSPPLADLWRRQLAKAFDHVAVEQPLLRSDRCLAVRQLIEQWIAGAHAELGTYREIPR